MKLFVILNAKGRVAGTARPTSLPTGWHARVVPGPGQTVREIEITEEHAALEPLELHAIIQSKYLRPSGANARPKKTTPGNRASSTNRKR